MSRYELWRAPHRAGPASVRRYAETPCDQPIIDRQEIVTKEAKMAAIVESIEIARRPEEVFAYVTDSSRFAEWQASVVSVRQQGTGPPAVGFSAVVTRQIGPRRLPGTEEITALHPPRTWAWRTGGGPVTGTVDGAIEPLDGGSRSRVTIALDFEGHGIGRLLVPLVVRRQVRRQLPKNEQKLKEALER